MTFPDDEDWFSPDFLPHMAEEDCSETQIPLRSDSYDTLPVHAIQQSGAGTIFGLFGSSSLAFIPSVDLSMICMSLSGAKRGGIPRFTIGQQLHSASSDSDFKAFCDDPDVLFSPRELGFLPLYWAETQRTFGELVTSFFRKKNSSRTRFLHKLFNALKIQSLNPLYYEHVGVKWVTDTILMVDKDKFARLLGIKSIEGSLFRKQGNFPSHGFVELCAEEASGMVPDEALSYVDFDSVRLLRHAVGTFVRGCGPEVDETCRWINTRKKEPTVEAADTLAD
jgi:hypothetical protein